MLVLPLSDNNPLFVYLRCPGIVTSLLGPIRIGTSFDPFYLFRCILFYFVVKFNISLDLN